MVAKSVSLPLHISGKQILDSNNAPIILRGLVKGICFVDAVGAYWMGVEGWRPDKASQELDIIKSWGANVIRMHSTCEFWINNTIDPVSGMHHRDIVHALAVMCASKGIYLVFDQYFTINQNSAGAQLDEVPWHPYLTSQEEAVMGSDSNGAGFVNMMASIASTMKDCPSFILEGWNEPHAPNSERPHYFQIVQAIVTAIRNAGFTGIFTYQWGYSAWVDVSSPPPSMDNSDNTIGWVTRYPITDPLNNLLVQTHQYWVDNGYGFAMRNGALVTSYADLALAEQDIGINYVLNTLNKPIFIGEFGGSTSYSNQTTCMAMFKNQLQIYQDLGIHYTCFWLRSELEHALVTSNTGLQPNSYGTALQLYLKANAPTVYRNVQINSNIQVAVKVDNEPKGNTDLTVQLQDGPHKIALPPEVTI